MRVHQIKAQRETSKKAVHRDSIGGYPVLAQDQEWPICGLCHTKMVCFFQLDLQKKFDLPLKSGSHLTVFMCPVHNDAPSDNITEHGRLPEEYWLKTYGHYRITLNHPRLKEAERPPEPDPYLVHHHLEFVQLEEEIDWDGVVERGIVCFKVGGVPSWRETPEYNLCACGAEMVFVCEIPAAFPFLKTDSAPVQPDGLSRSAYHLFLGLETYIFVCKDICTPHSLWAVSHEIASKEAEMVR